MNQDLLPADKDLVVYADILRLSGELVLHEHNVTLWARELHIGDDARPYTMLFTSGKHPADAASRAKDGDAGQIWGASGTEGKGGDPGSAGHNAGNVSITAGMVAGSLQVMAMGGAGQMGQPGGVGGQGHDGQVGRDADTGPPGAKAAIGQEGGSGGDGGNAGRSGDGGRGGNLRVFMLDRSYAPPHFPHGNIGASVAGGAPGTASTPGAGGAPGTGGLGGRLAKTVCWGNSNGGGCSTFLDSERTTQGGNGARGRTGNSVSRISNPSKPAVPAANYGPSGTYTATTNGKPGDLIPTQGPTMNLLLQRTLTLRQAELYYWNAAYANAYTLLRWIADTTPASDSQRVPPDHVDEWKQLHNRAMALIGYLKQGLDFYGRPRNHVPLASLSFYRQEALTLIQIGKIIEDACNRYSDTQRSIDERRQQLATTLDQVQAHLDKAQRDLTADQSAQNDTQDRIAILYSAQLAQQKVVLAAQESFRQAAENAAPGCTFVEVIMGTATFLLVSKSAFSNLSNIKDAVGELGNAEDKLKGVIRTVETVGKEVADLQSKWAKIKSVITPDQPDAGKIVSQPEDFATHVAKFDSKMDEIVESTSDSALKTAALNYKQQVHTYLDIVQARNQAVYQYTCLVRKEVRLKAEIAAKETERARVQNQMAANVDPTLPLFRTFMQGAYEDIKGHILRYMYEENQAFNYWALQDRQFQVANQTIAMLATTHANLIGEVEDVLTGRSSARQTFTGVTFTISADDHAPEFAAFRSGHLNPAGRKAHHLTFSITLENTPFEKGWYQVIATEFQISIPNAKAGAANLEVDLMHSGRAVFHDSTKKAVEYSHTPTLQDYTYRLSDGVKIGGGSFGGGATNPDLIGVSPHTTWTVIIDDDFNSGVDLSGVTSLTLTFGGLYYPLKPGAK